MSAADAELLIDDANGVFAVGANGVFALGAHGRGSPELCGVNPGEAILGSMSKALGCTGGFLAGRRFAKLRRLSTWTRISKTSSSS